MHPRGHGCAMPLDRRAAGADRTRCAMRPIAGDMDIRHGRRRPRETSGTFAGHEGTEKASCIEAETVVALEVVAVAREASRAVRSTDTVTATPSAPNKRPAAHVDSDTPRSPQATAGQLHRGASRSNAGPNRLRRKTADRPAKLNDPRRPGPLTRRRARSIPRAAHRPPMRPPASRPAAVRGPSLPGLITTPSLARSAGTRRLRTGRRRRPLPALTVRAGADCSCPGQGRRDEPRGRTRMRSPQAGHPDGPCPGSGGANPMAAESVRRRTRPNRSSGSGAGRTGRCAGTRPRPGCR